MNFDIVIVGGGPAGLSFACSIRHLNLKIAVIEKQSEEELENPAIDGRDIALTHLSRHLMQQHGSWQRIGEEHISPIKQAEVMDGDSDYTLDFKVPEDGTDALGFLIANHFIRKAVFAECDSISHLTLMDQCTVSHVYTDNECATVVLNDGRKVTASLLVAADSRFSTIRRQVGISSDAHDFGRSAIVCEVEHEKSHHNTAFECFHYGRTLAVLPMPEKVSSIVITVPSAQVPSILDMSEHEFCQDIEQRLKGKLGQMQQIGKRYTYPLVGVHANQFYANRVVLIGDAAVGMHPVTAHGFNLGLSGQDLLANEIIAAVNDNVAFYSEHVLNAYQRQHMRSSRLLYHGTNSIVSLFTNDAFPATLLRKLALRVSNHFPPIKYLIEQKLMAKRHSFDFLPPFLR